MPLPQRKPSEPYDAFIARCMQDPLMVREFPDVHQRRAVCEQQVQTRTEARLHLVCNHDAITIEAANGDDETTRLPRFRMTAYTGGPMRITGWQHPVIIDLDGLVIPSQIRPIRFSHDPTAGVGHTDTICIEGGQLIATGVVSRDTAIAREIVVSASNGFPWQASIAASVEDFEFIKKGKKVVVNGREVSGPVNVVRKATLGEISFVDLGADCNTSASVVAGSLLQQEQYMETHEDKTMVDAEVATQQTVAEIRAEAAAEKKRIAAIRDCFAGRHPHLEAQAIEDNWDIGRCERELALADLRDGRPKAPAVHVHNEPLTGRVLEAACMLTAKASAVETLFDSPTLEAAQRRFRGGIGLQELLLEAAWANGYTGRNFRDSRAVLQSAFRPDVAAGFSTIDIGGILSNVANKFLLEGFFSVERTWRNITAVRNVSDFKTVTSYRLVGKEQYEQVAPGGTLKHGTLGEEKYENKANTYGLMLTIDREDIINDDLNAITTVPRKLGRGSGLKINDVFWSVFLNNATFFTSGNKNYITGADTALSIDGLTRAEVAFMEQVDTDGKPIGVMPAIMLVPPSLSAIGSQLFKSMELRDTTSSTKYPVANPHQGKFRVEVSRYLSNAQYAGNSTKAWYLLADPNDLPTIEVVFLNGQETPTIETADADFANLGIQMRGYHDFGVALQDPRGGVKVKGEV